MVGTVVGAVAGFATAVPSALTSDLAEPVASTVTEPPALTVPVVSIFALFVLRLTPPARAPDDCAVAAFVAVGCCASCPVTPAFAPKVALRKTPSLLTPVGTVYVYAPLSFFVISSVTVRSFVSSLT